MAATNEILHKRLGRALTPNDYRKKHLKQFISKYESLDTEMPGIRKFQDTPQSQPLTICVECPPDLDLTHQDIMTAAESILPNAFALGKITSIQFENVNVICGSSGLKNRWTPQKQGYRSVSRHRKARRS
ncbi:putative uncharacterized protein C19orf81 isoform X3 [Stegostoma tigrinum]|uniref:putative uncharacterized protein C19orf81 isoform X3 n=1 Tax=Stegostoma tigrinum TaxID=3053191 RepID=UPI00202AEF71|nr:putative uncharacterized protein C19orf81 isoform X3 [Stegostoma tigrinum]